jgi:hypothetical protein
MNHGILDLPVTKEVHVASGKQRSIYDRSRKDMRKLLIMYALYTDKLQ